jgi:hypothetical protein
MTELRVKLIMDKVVFKFKRATDTAVSVSFIARASLKHGTGTAVSVSFIARNYFCSRRDRKNMTEIRG